MVYGNGGGILKRMVDDAQRLGGAYCIGEGGNRWPFVHIDDLADLYRRAIESAAAGSLFYAVSGDSIQLRLLAEKVSHAAGTKGRVISMTLEAP